MYKVDMSNVSLLNVLNFIWLLTLIKASLDMELKLAQAWFKSGEDVFEICFENNIYTYIANF